MSSEREETHAETKPGGDLLLGGAHLIIAAKAARKAGNHAQAKRYELAAISVYHAVDALAGKRDAEEDPRLTIV